jgi:DNA-directed RNA polymerase subunit beta'
MFENEQIELQAPLVTRIDGKAIETTVGRLIFNEALVDEVEYLNEHMTKGKMGDLVSRMREIADLDDVVKTLDKIKELTLQYGTKSGFSMSKSDLMSYSGKEEGVGEAEQKEKEVIAQYENGLLTEEEKDKLIQRLWLDTTEDLLNKAWDELKQDEENATYLHIKAKMNGTLDHVKQVCAIKGLVKDPTGTWVNLPIKANYTEGLSVFDFFIASKGGRKGLADTALRTADSGYLTRKLVDVAHSSIIRMEDCGYEEEGIEIKRESNRKLGFVQTMKGRVLAQDVKVKKKVIAKKGDFVDMELANKIDKSGVDSVWIRSLLTCQAPKGLCSKCYGADMGTNELVEVGKAVGVIAAQAIGELSTQMTLRTFHFGGSKEKDITQGLPKIIELFEARDPKFEAEIAEVDGVVKVKPGKAKTTILVEGVKKWHKDYLINDVKEISVEDGDKVSVGDELYQIDEDDIVTATKSGTVSIKGNLLRLSSDKVSATQEVQVSNEVDILVESGDEVKAGDPLTEGSVSAEELMETRSMLDAQLHTLEELQEVYLDQAISIHDKHLEVIIREMGRAAKVLEPGDSDYVVDEIGNRHLMDLKNEVLVEEGKTPIAYRPVMLGITKASLNREGILSPLSFQEQVKTLTSVSLKGDIDYLNGLKENVIIGRLIPHGDRAHIEDPKSMHEVTDMLDGPPKS